MPPKVIPRIKQYPMGAQYLTHRNPWVPVWWSVALPGFGHLYIGDNLKGIIFMSWEILVNLNSHLNIAIFHTLTGNVKQTNAVLRHEWLIIYPLFYAFTMFDAYRSCLELNRLACMERVQKRRQFDIIGWSIFGTSFVTHRDPLMAALWSAALPGAGQFYAGRGLKSLTMMGWYLAVVLQSGMANAIFHTVLGEWEAASRNLNFQWLLFWPSIYIFGIVDAYTEVVEQNRIAEDAFRWRMRKYLRNGLQ